MELADIGALLNVSDVVSDLQEMGILGISAAAGMLGASYLFSKGLPMAKSIPGLSTVYDFTFGNASYGPYVTAGVAVVAGAMIGRYVGRNFHAGAGAGVGTGIALYGINKLVAKFAPGFAVSTLSGDDLLLGLSNLQARDVQPLPAGPMMGLRGFHTRDIGNGPLGNLAATLVS